MEQLKFIKSYIALMYKYFVFLLILLLSLSCKSKNYKNTELTLVSQDTLLAWKENGHFPKPKIVDIRDRNGNPISLDSITNMKNPRDVRRDYYVNSNNEIVKIVITDADADDKLFFDRMNNYGEQPSKDIVNIVTIKCEEKRRILESVLERDQSNRSNGVESIDVNIDIKNLEIVFSLLNKCGENTFENLTSNHGMAIFLTIQHSNNKWRKFFLPLLKSDSASKVITKQQIALLTDRILMDSSKPQIYGTQIQNNQLYKVDNLDSVHIRRKEIGLLPLSEYLHGFGITIVE